MYLGSVTYPGPLTYPGLPPTPLEYDTAFYVGPVGGLIPLPGVESGVDTALVVIGGTHTSLTGAFTQDTFGYKRSWTWTYPMLTDRQARHVAALNRNLVPGPIYLIDPRQRNRLPEQIASGGSLLRNPSGFIPSNTTTCLWRPLNYPSADMTTLPAHPILRGALEWQVLAAGSAGIELAGHALDGRHNVPVLSQEVLRASWWATGPESTTATGTVTIFDAGGNQLVAQTVPGVLLSSATWRRVHTSFICPANAAYLRLSLAVGSDTPVGSIYVTALSVERYHPTYVPGLTQYCDELDFGDWSLGGGAPQVIPTPGQSTGNTGYIRPGLQSAALTLIER